MTPRLPLVGADNDLWGAELNEFLGVSFNDDGSLKNGAPLAQSGQTPSQAPPGYGWVGGIGSLNVARRADGVDPIFFVPVVAAVGDYLEPCRGTQNAGFVMAEGREYAGLFGIPFAMSFDQLLIGVNTNGTSGSVVRLGIRAFQPGVESTPGAKILDAGTVVTTGLTGTPKAAAATVSLTLAAGLYWVTATAQGGAGTPVTAQLAGSWHTYVSPGFKTPAMGRSYSGVYQAGVSAALPTSFATTDAVLDNAMPYMALRRSA